jgi:hypothetical protein
MNGCPRAFGADFRMECPESGVAGTRAAIDSVEAKKFSPL